MNTLFVMPPTKIGTPREILEPQDSNLETVWYRKDGMRYYTVICRLCSCRVLYLWENGVRCRDCGSFHTHDRFSTLRLKCKKLARMNDGHVKGIRRIVARPGKGHFVFNQKTKKLLSLQDAKDAEVMTLLLPGGRAKVVRFGEKKQQFFIPSLTKV